MSDEIPVVADTRSHGRYGRRGLPNELVEKMYRDYQRLKSVAKVGALHGRTRQAVWEILKTKKLQLRSKRFREKIVYGGQAYSMHKGYLRRTSGDRIPLHHVVWIEANGPIPDGHNIRFRDEDRRNCVLDNLHCAPIQEISSITSTGENQHTKQRQTKTIIDLDPVLRGMAVNIARKHYQLSIDPDDLLQAGRVAVRDADRKFHNDKKEGSSRGYVITAARYAMLGWIKEHGRNVRTPSNKFYTAGVSEFSIQAPVGNDQDSGTYEELFLSADETTTSDATLTGRNAVLAKALKRLPRRDRVIMEKYFFAEMTLEQIGGELGVTRGAIRQRIAISLAALKRSRNLKSLKKELAA
jgi:RNA polymerase sigma factor (sigma-70 family)